ncbi:hypothetical protein [Neobacillus jeddahensis]|nr:hypothetical protein [Neobacillus jeddahensis]
MKTSNSTKDSRTKNRPEIRMWMQSIANPKERQELLRNLEISAEFEMRYRGLFTYYGKDLITYKLQKPSDKNRNEFLRILSKFMTDCLEDNCPASWLQCQPSFWEEFIFMFFPHSMKVTAEEKQVEAFLLQLKKFVRWLDKNKGTSWSPVVKDLIVAATPELKDCEHLLNSLFLLDYPLLFHPDWDPEQDFERMNQEFAQCADRSNSIFEVTSKIENTVVLTDIDTHCTYYVKGLPYQLIEPGIIMSGIIGRKRDEFVWKWYQTDGIYPQIGKNYM